MPSAGPISRAVTSALKDAPTLARDAAAIALVKRYARHLDAHPDSAELMDTLGPKLLAALTALGMTPAGRGAKGGGPSVSPVARKLDEFTARRARKHGS